MFFCLIIALFAVFSLSVYSSPCPAPSSTSDTTPSSTTNTTTSSTPVPTPSVLAPVTAYSSNGPFTDGVATYFYQNGNPGACGQYNSDSAFICAMDQTRFGTSGPASPLCNQRVQITNKNNGQTITVTVADDCPTCMNQDSIDLSVGAFEALSFNNLAMGEFPISWSYV